MPVEGELSTLPKPKTHLSLESLSSSLLELQSYCERNVSNAIGIQLEIKGSLDYIDSRLGVIDAALAAAGILYPVVVEPVEVPPSDVPVSPKSSSSPNTHRTGKGKWSKVKPGVSAYNLVIPANAPLFDKDA